MKTTLSTFLRADFAFGSYRYLPARDREVFVEIAYRML